MIAQLTQVFWQKGFTATSLDDLSAATSLTRPSLYSAFGNKLDMFVLCLTHFASRMAATSKDATKEAESLDAALLGIFSSLMDMYFADTNDVQELGCLMFSNAVVDALVEPVIKEVISVTLEQVGHDFRHLIKLHCPDVSPEQLEEAHELVLSTFLGLGLRIRSGASRPSMDRSVATSVNGIVGILNRVER